MKRRRSSASAPSLQLRAALALGAMCACGACASALRDDPKLDEITRGIEAPAAGALPETLARAEAAFASRTLDGVRTARELWRAAAAADPSKTDGFVGTAETSVWLTEHEPDAAAREADSSLAVEAAHWCAWTFPRSAPCWYWLGAALGVRAREHPTTALAALDQILAAFERARAIDPTLEEAGPDRAMALVYLRAPGWPAGPGDEAHGLRHARQAVHLKPGFPPNLLALAEALAANDQEEDAVAQYRKARDAARELAASGDPDAAEWADEADQALEVKRERR